MHTICFMNEIERDEILINDCLLYVFFFCASSRAPMKRGEVRKITKYFRMTTILMILSSVYIWKNLHKNRSKKWS